MKSTPPILRLLPPLLILLLASGCGSTRDQQNNQRETCTCPDSTMKDTTDRPPDMPPPPEPDSDPDLARVEGTILDMAQRDSIHVMRLQITRVREAGRSVPPLRSGFEIEVAVPPIWIETVSEMGRDKKIVSLLNYQQVSAAGSGYPRWKLREITALK